MLRVLLWAILAARPALADATALGDAYSAYRKGDFAKALRETMKLGKRIKNHDYALYIAAQALYLEGDRLRALRSFRELTRERESRFAGIAVGRVADCLWELGRWDDARREYERILLTKGPLDLGVPLFRLGEYYEREGKKSLAISYWRRLVLELPAHPLATRVLPRLIDMGELAARDRLARTEKLTETREWTRALDELALITDEEPPEIMTLKDFWTGETLFKMRREYARAGQLLIGVHEKMAGKAARALFHGARALSRVDRDDEAIGYYREVVRKYPTSDFADEALFLAAWLEFNRGRYSEALPGLAEVRERYPRSSYADEAVWYIGFAHFLLGNNDEALAWFARLATETGALVGGKGQYWRARTFLKLGRDPEATAALVALVTRHPFSWYALLARARLNERGIVLGPFGEAQARAVREIGRIDPRIMRSPVISRVDELLSAGMRTEAAFELARRERTLLDRYGARALPVLFDRYRRAGNFNRPWVLAESHGSGALRGPPSGSARQWWEHAYPLAFRDLVERHQDLGKNPPYYLYSIMRKESGFNPNDVSYADAIGLMQMIPPTTRRVAPLLGLEYTDDFLYDPELNVKVGSWYIGGLAHKFKVQIPISAGSFNCGPRPIMKWLDRFGARPLDEFVELVPYKQTREYMKKVTDAYARYLYLYEGIDYKQPLTIDARYVNDTLDY